MDLPTGSPLLRGALDRWLATAGQAELIRGLETLISGGGAVIDGRRDRPPSRSFEPMILGVIHGSAAGLSRGGRPTVSARDELVMHMLAPRSIHQNQRAQPHNPIGMIFHG